MFAEVTLSALNAPEGDVDIESLGEQTTVKKLEFDSGQSTVQAFASMDLYHLFAAHLFSNFYSPRL